ncbi:hypothetical protein FBU30_005127 [Linnemannia zychae]|nr:hypothetical protein FBU30_005127 [Linnemannia zychae]
MPSSALLPSGRFKSSSPVSPPKTVQIDESKNIVYSYQAGSTIIVSQSLSPSEQLYYDDEDDGGNDNDYEYIHKNDISSPIKNVSGFTTSSSSLSLPKWPWSAVASNISSSNQPETTNSTVKYDVASKSPSPNPSWTFEPSSSLDSVLNDSSNGTNTFMNIASSLDRLWSSPPSTLRRTYSEVTSSSSSRGNNSRTPSVSMLASSNINNRNIDNRLPRIPALRRQASMPSLENDPLEQDKHSQSKHLTWNPEHTLQTLGTTLSGPSVTVTCDSTESENEITMTDAESEHRTMVLDAATSTTTSTSSSGLTKGSRGAIRRRDTRQLHHPYRRPTVASTTASTSQNESFIIPPQIRRSASFSGTATTPIAQPVLRREASTTAYMDIL